MQRDKTWEEEEHFTAALKLSLCPSTPFPNLYPSSLSLSQKLRKASLKSPKRTVKEGEMMWDIFKEHNQWHQMGLGSNPEFHHFK